jgi:hypothetical protein
VTRLDRMKHGSGIKGRDDRSSGIKIRVAEALATTKFKVYLQQNKKSRKPRVIQLEKRQTTTVFFF